MPSGPYYLYVYYRTWANSVAEPVIYVHDNHNAWVEHIEDTKDEDQPPPSLADRLRKLGVKFIPGWISAEQAGLNSEFMMAANQGLPTIPNSGQGASDSGPSRERLPATNLLPTLDFAGRSFFDPSPSKYGSTDLLPDSQQASRVPSPELRRQSPPVLGNVKYLPSQANHHADISAIAKQSSPLYQIGRDAWVFFSMIRYIPGIFLPLRTKEPANEFYPSAGNIIAKALITFASIIELLAMLLVPILLILPIPPALLIIGGLLVRCLIWLILRPTQGPKVVMSQTDVLGQYLPIGGTMHPSHLFKNERWLFLNGVLTQGIDLQKSVDAIAKTFGRPVLGIHNESYGFTADIFECIIQRCLSYPAKDGRIAYEAVKASLVDPEVKKVVLIAHSQGGIEASLVLDRLLATLPPEMISKLEIYTFGSAANHFHNPVIAWLKPPINFKSNPSGANPLRPHPAKYLITHMEHYANEFDLVPRWGVLYSLYKLMSEHYSGRVFIHLGASGHYFNQHYLSAMFPLDAQAASRFREQVVHVETDLPHQKEAELRRTTGKMKKRSTFKGDVSTPHGLRHLWLNRWGIDFGDGHTINMPIGRLGPGEIAFLDGHAEAEAAKGKTVGELSRLWRYAGGGVPED